MPFKARDAPKGICVACGKSTKKHIHQECGEKMRKKLKQRRTKVRKGPYKDGFINMIVNRDR